MRLGIMQPYFFPYLGYFDLINYTDEWIVFDTAQYIRHGWVNRNRVLHPQDSWLYIKVPLAKHSRDTAITDIHISEQSAWQDRILGQLKHYRTYASYADDVIDLVQSSISLDTTSLSILNVSILHQVCAYLGIRFHYQFFSSMDLDLGPVDGPGDWALRISEAVGASEYVNPPGGVDLFDPMAFEQAGIKLTIRHLRPLEYECKGYNFIPNLSIIDVLMWNSPEKVKSHLEQHRATNEDEA